MARGPQRFWGNYCSIFWPILRVRLTPDNFASGLSPLSPMDAPVATQDAGAGGGHVVAQVHSHPFDRARCLADRVLRLHEADVPGALAILLDTHTTRPAQAKPVDFGLPSSPALNRESSQLHPAVSVVEGGDVAAVPASRLQSPRGSAAMPDALTVVLRLSRASSDRLARLEAYVQACSDGGSGEPHVEAVCDVCANKWCSEPPTACGNDTCDTAVHQDCFGSLHRRSNGAWLCWKCTSGRRPLQPCAVCGRVGGAQRATAVRDSGGPRTAHVLCALYAPEVRALGPRSLSSLSPTAPHGLGAAGESHSLTAC